ncbi:prostate stem cell antigen [Aplysia californica]|uniref:Prostate stem cell antigen n=1 Tax=Aplysia californica TaxID=6500 RepID=A0ABM0JV86_APLCA|nr:prostate stem cell antigen [Aplysia californica]
MELCLSFWLLLSLLGTGLALECYVCQNQMDNKDKCIKTSVQCREEQDTCLTFIEWRAPDFWTPRSEKIHYIHKNCSSSSFCGAAQTDLGLRCMRDWYRDWQCVECCQGDRCNFYVTLGSSVPVPSIFVLATSICAILIQHFR